MAGATFYTAWFSSSGSLVVTQRTSNGYVAPPLSSNQGITSSRSPTNPPSSHPSLAPSSNTLSPVPSPTTHLEPPHSLPLSPPISSGQATLAPTATISLNTLPAITVPSNSISAKSEPSPRVQPPPPNSTQSSCDCSMACLCLSRGASCLTLVIFVARYLKDRMGHAWYLTHLGLMLGGVGVFTVAGLIAIELPIASGVSRFIGTWHGLFGTILALGLWPIQVALGFISNKLWSPNRPAVPWWDQLHWWMGRLLVVGSVAIMYYGLVLFEAPSLAYVGLFLWIGVCVIVLVAGQFAIGVVHHVAKPEENIGMNSNLGQAQGNHAYRGKV
ncbi:hypothetical protein BC829DRAFT_80537 [Chytridium lagenaria]|nr:hypothetical protein BC829DRAFT_80537 [Chytridium lagenaria]